MQMLQFFPLGSKVISFVRHLVQFVRQNFDLNRKHVWFYFLPKKSLFWSGMCDTWDLESNVVTTKTPVKSTTAINISDFLTVLPIWSHHYFARIPRAENTSPQVASLYSLSPSPQLVSFLSNLSPLNKGDNEKVLYTDWVSTLCKREIANIWIDPLIHICQPNKEKTKKLGKFPINFKSFGTLSQYYSRLFGHLF